jgi:hypothetical protein
LDDTVSGLARRLGIPVRAWSRRRRRLVLLSLAVVLCLSLLSAGWMVLRGVQARHSLVQAATLVKTLSRQVEQGDIGSARRTLASLQVATQSAREQTADLGWRVGTHVPLLGRNLAAVQVVAQSLDDVADSGLPTLLDAAASVDVRTFVPKNGRIDVAALDSVAPRLAAARTSFAHAHDRVSKVAVAGLLPPVRAGVSLFRDGIGRLLAVTGTALRAAVVLPSMLGMRGARTYLVMFQNPAELRASGGMPGAFVIMRAERGVIQIQKHGTAAIDLGVFDKPVLPIDPEMDELYGDRLATFPANVNLTPHFPTTAALAVEMYRRRSGQTVDGVLSVDPVALSYLLRATGPVPMAAGPPLTAQRAVPMLLSEAYAQTSTRVEKDQYFASAAKAVFDVLSRGAVNPGAAVAALAQAAGERRILLWSADPKDREAIAGTVLEGVLPERDGTRPTVGVFLNDGSGAKLDYYLRFAAELRSGRCRKDGRRELTVRVTLRSTVPSSGLPQYVLGLGLAGDPYTARTNVMIFSPSGGAVVGARMDGVEIEIGSGSERGRSVGVVTVDVPPGQSRTVEATLLSDVLPPRSPISAELWLTPAASPWQKTIESVRTCG